MSIVMQLSFANTVIHMFNGEITWTLQWRGTVKLRAYGRNHVLNLLHNRDNPTCICLHQRL